MAQANLDRNFPPGHEARARARIQQLRWGDPHDIAQTQPPFDLLLGSDIIYHKDSHAELADTLAALSDEGTVVLIATPDGSADESRRDEAQDKYRWTEGSVGAVRRAPRMPWPQTERPGSLALKCRLSLRPAALPWLL